MAEIKTFCRLPEGAMAVEVIEICAFIDTEGTNRWVYRVQGDSPLSTTVGLVEMAKFHLLSRCVDLSEEE